MFSSLSTVSIVLFALVPVLAVTERQCSLFEGPLNYFDSHPYLHVLSMSSQTTSVLIAHIAELKDPYIEGLEISERVIVEDELFPLCAQDIIGPTPGCQAETFDLSNVTHKTLKYGIYNSILEFGEAVSYEIEAAGVYCVLLHQFNEDVSQNVTIIDTHGYGTDSAQSTVPINAIVWVMICLAIQLGPLKFLVDACTGPYRRVEVWRMYVPIVISKVVFEAWHILVDAMLRFRPHSATCVNPPSTLWVDKWLILDQVVSITFIALMAQLLTCIYAIAHHPQSLMVCLDQMVLFVVLYASQLSELSLFFVESGPLVIFLRDVRCAFLATSLTLLGINLMEDIRQRYGSGHLTNEGLPTSALFIATLGNAMAFTLCRPETAGVNCSPEMRFTIGLFQDTRTMHIHLVMVEYTMGYIWVHLPFALDLIKVFVALAREASITVHSRAYMLCEPNYIVTW